MGLQPMLRYYDVPVNRSRVGQGTAVVVRVEVGVMPDIYMEDELVI